MVADRTVVCASELPHLFFFFYPRSLHNAEKRIARLDVNAELFGTTIIGYFRRDEKMNKQITCEGISRGKKKWKKYLEKRILVRYSAQNSPLFFINCLFNVLA